MVRARAVTLLLVAGALACCAAPAGAQTLAPLHRTAPGQTAPTVVPLRDRVLHARSATARAHAAAAPERAYRTADGTTIDVQVSSSFTATTPDNQTAVQSYVDFLGSRLHGSELGRLHLFIGTPQEINAQCGGAAGVVACYVQGEHRMYVPSQDPTAGGSPFTREYVVTHEYGHHIAAFRRNDPFPALDFGPKYWSSYEHVCAGAAAHVYFPGNQGAHYLDDPGEGWADAYAHLHYPTVPWQFAPSLAPDAGAFAAIRRDVTAPWSGPAIASVRRRLSGRRRVTTIAARFSLDGVMSLRLAGPLHANYDLQVQDGGRVVASSHARGSRDRLAGTVCRDRGTTGTVTIRVRRRSGSGPFTLRVSAPG
jgi:hypothetical protein